jgi:hypothetical protein
MAEQKCQLAVAQLDTSKANWFGLLPFYYLISLSTSVSSSHRGKEKALLEAQLKVLSVFVRFYFS